jgi:hypothetical protein
MGLKLKYIKDDGYDVYEEYLEALDSLDFGLSLTISEYIDSKVLYLPVNDYISYVLGGVVKYENKTVFFALEIIRTQGSFLMLSDLQIISSDDYLDLINLNLHIK